MEGCWKHHVIGFQISIIDAGCLSWPGVSTISQPKTSRQQQSNMSQSMLGIAFRFLNNFICLAQNKDSKIQEEVEIT